VSSKHAHTFSFEGVPDVASPVVVTSKKESSRDGERDRRNTAQDMVVGEGVQLSVSTNVKQPAGGVVGTGGKGVTIGEEPAC
jgi:hypothetical protein